MNTNKPTAPEKKYALKEAEKIITCGFPCDLDTASVALDQAHAILDVLTVATGKTAIPDTYPNTLVQSLYAAMGKVGRAREALFGPRSVRS